MQSGASVLAGVLDTIESVLGARIGPDQHSWRCCTRLYSPDVPVHCYAYS